MRASNFQSGVVTLIGAGPGDPDLLTVKAARSIEQAHCIVYDNLVSEEIRALFPEQAKLIYVGKAKGQHSFTQDRINDLLLDLARSGRNVCRVKGGDAFVFGRGGEEMLTLAKAGIQVDVIPGITAASGCSSLAQIPLTHRGLAQGCTFITAHAGKQLELDWSALARLNQTIVVYMGLSKTQLLTEQLISSGMSGTTPVAFIENGCTPRQRTFTGELQYLTELKQEHQIQSPALIVIGKVVSVAQQMQWLQLMSNRARTNHAQPQNYELTA